MEGRINGIVPYKAGKSTQTGGNKVTNNELSLAVAIAESDQTLDTFVGEGSSQALNTTFDGFGLADFEPVTITVRMLASLVRHQCMQMNGEFNSEALNEIATVGRRKFVIVGLGDDETIAAIARCAAMV